MANIIQKVQKPTLVLAHNKTLAGQLYSEFKEFFPKNNVEYFVSYYDYYQPESYIPSSDTGDRVTAVAISSRAKKKRPSGEKPGNEDEATLDLLEEESEEGGLSENEIDEA